jgi:hypothetical protein
VASPGGGEYHYARLHRRRSEVGRSPSLGNGTMPLERHYLLSERQRTDPGASCQWPLARGRPTPRASPSTGGIQHPPDPIWQGLERLRTANVGRARRAVTNPGAGDLFRYCRRWMDEQVIRWQGKLWRTANLKHLHGACLGTRDVQRPFWSFW